MGKKIKKFQRFLARQGRYSRVLGLRSYLSCRFAPKGTPVKVTIFGHPIWVRAGTRDMGVAISCLGGEFEPLRGLLDRNFGGVIVDAGGYIGTAAIALCEIYPQAKIITIEPSQENIAVLRRNTAPYDQIKVVQGALGGNSGERLKLRNRGTGHWGYSVVEKPGDRPDANVLEEVASFALSDLVPDTKKIGILKLDIEGAEKSLFENEHETLSAIPVIFAELHDRIVQGCSAGFLEFSRDRKVMKCGGEKYLSLSKDSPETRSEAENIQSAA